MDCGLDRTLVWIVDVLGKLGVFCRWMLLRMFCASGCGENCFVVVFRWEHRAVCPQAGKWRGGAKIAYFGRACAVGGCRRCSFLQEHLPGRQVSQWHLGASKMGKFCLGKCLQRVSTYLDRGVGQSS